MKKTTPPLPRPLHSGLTLIELITVIAIVSILMVIVATAVPRMRSNANKTKCLNNLRQLGLAAKMYASEASLQANPSVNDWLIELSPYLSLPVEIKSLAHLQRIPLSVAEHQVLWCPAMEYNNAPQVVQRDRNCYGINASNYASFHSQTPPGKFLTPTDAARHPSGVIAFMDAVNRNVFYSMPERIDSGRHDGHVNVVFADGHVQSIPHDTGDTSLNNDWLRLFGENILP